MDERRDAWTLLYALVFALTFVGYPTLSSVLGAFDAYARIFSIVYRALLLLSVMLLIRYAVYRIPAKDWQGPVVVAFVALWVMMIARFAWDSSFVPIPLPLQWLEQLIMMVGVVLIPTIAVFHAPSEKAFDIARRILLVGGVISGIFLVIAEIRTVIETGEISALRRVGTDALNPVMLGHIGTIVVIVSLLGPPLQGAKAIVARVVDSLFVRVTAGAIGGFLAVAAASKGPLLALFAVVVVSQVVRVSRAPTAAAVLAAITRLALLVAALAALGIFLALFAGVTVIDRFAEFGTDYSANERLLIWTRAIQEFESSPWIGASFVEIKERFYPHNLILEVLMATGIAGFCALCVVLGASAIAAFRVLFTRHTWVALLFVQVFIGTMLSGSVYFSEGFWVALAGVLALDRLLARQAQRIPESSAAPLAHAGGA
ncbi:MAG TPA: O-antigen ligase family protein [Gammaproteobacteria bacterium]